MDETAAARLFAAMARLADSGQDYTPAPDLAASMAKLAVDYPPEVLPCFLPTAQLCSAHCRSVALLGHHRGCSAALQ